MSAARLLLWNDASCSGPQYPLRMTSLLGLIGADGGVCGARNVSSASVAAILTRRSSDVIHGIDSLVRAIFFVSIVGLGPFAGILAIAVHDTGILTKLFAEAIENTDREQAKGVRATGANRTQTIGFGILPQVMPVLLGNSLYFLESDVRSATLLGVVGAGGIGFFLMDRMMISAWLEVSLIVIMVLVTVACIDALSRVLRVRLIGAVGR
jgi:phosphonate transport system permease protein